MIFAPRNQDDVIRDIRAALPADESESLDWILADLKEQIESETKRADDAEIELEGAVAQEDYDALRSTLLAVHAWFDSVLTLHKPMTDPRKMARMVEEAIRG